ncbi:MAG: RDD family protein [Anaerolineales bacterium]|nr:RDD family protein [Anaerolineales bacterium]
MFSRIFQFRELDRFYYLASGLLQLVLGFAVFTWFEGQFGTTPGKIPGVDPMQFRVLTKDGRKTGPGRAALRALIGLFEINPTGDDRHRPQPAETTPGRYGRRDPGGRRDQDSRCRIQTRSDHAYFACRDGRSEEIVQIDKAAITKWLGDRSGCSSGPRSSARRRSFPTTQVGPAAGRDRGSLSHPIHRAARLVRSVARIIAPGLVRCVRVAIFLPLLGISHSTRAPRIEDGRGVVSSVFDVARGREERAQGPLTVG